MQTPVASSCRCGSLRAAPRSLASFKAVPAVQSSVLRFSNSRRLKCVSVEAAMQQPAPAHRIATIKRKTKETEIEVTVNIDGTGVCIADTPVHFLNHMLDQISSHGLFDITVRAKGDTHIDDHHTTEDIALAFGSALSEALGDRKGIQRFGEFSAPLDEALTHVVLDLSGRPHLSFHLPIPTERIGNFDTQLVEHFFQSFVNTSGTTLHIRQLAGQNSHHIVESTFKAFARALRKASEYDERRGGMVASSKGVLTQK